MVNDADLYAIAQYCPDLRQLDVLGNSYLTPDGLVRYVVPFFASPFIIVHVIIYLFSFRILENCRQMQLLDVSYCSQIAENCVTAWKLRFPHVSIKRISLNEI